jgi:hypothetical protein
VAERVHASTSGATGHLAKLGCAERAQAHGPAARSSHRLSQAADDGRAGRHIDPGRERLSGEDDLEEPGLKETLDERLPAREQAGMMDGQATREIAQVRVMCRARRVTKMVGDEVVLALALGAGEQLQVRAAEERGLAAATAEVEVDGGQEVAFRQGGDDFVGVGGRGVEASDVGGWRWG